MNNQKNIPFLDLQAAYRELKTEIDAAVARVLDSGWYVLGPEVEAFEKEYANYCEVQHAVGVGNGLDALMLALRAVGVAPGDEVIVPSHTYIATWLAVSHCGAIPVPVEPCLATFNISPDHIAEAITSRTRAIVPVHLYGQPADIGRILQLAREYNLKIVEDAAQAHGARYRGQRIGAHGHAVAWSFYPGKNLGALGDGGCVTTNDIEVANRIRMLRNYGSRDKHVNEVQGVNSRLDPLHAAVLRAKLRFLNEWNERRRDLASKYTQILGGDGLVLPSVPEWAEPVWHLYVVRTSERDALQALLGRNGISTMVHYPVPPHLQNAYNVPDREQWSLPLSEKLAKEVLSLPIGPQQKANAVHVVADVINGFR